MEERDVLIVGAGPAGLSTAIFTQLDGWSTLVLENKWVGGQAAIAYTVTNYPGFLPGDGATLMENMEKQVTSLPPEGVGAELRHENVISIDAGNKIIITESNQYRGQVIIMATGSTMQKLGVQGEEKFLGRGVSYYAKRDMKELTGKKVLVVGGGNSTAKSALLARTVASEVFLIHRRDALRAYPAMVKRMQKEGIQIWYNTELVEIKGNDRVENVVLVNTRTDQKKEIEVDWIVICVGTQSDIRLATAAGLETGEDFVKVDGNMMTSKKGIFACGEITGCERHIISAANEGAHTGMIVSEYLALEMIKRGDKFEGSKNGKYMDEFEAMLKK